MNLNGKELLAAPLTLSLFRPATDNDNRDKNGARLWRNAGLDNLTQKVVSLKEGKTSTTARVEILNAKAQKIGTADFVYSLDKNGALKVLTTFQPDTTIVKSMARLGLTFRVANTYDQVSTSDVERMKHTLTAISPAKSVYIRPHRNGCFIIMLLRNLRATAPMYVGRSWQILPAKASL